MIENIDRLPNDNIFLWSCGFDNVLILSGGHVLLLKVFYKIGFELVGTKEISDHKIYLVKKKKKNS